MANWTISDLPRQTGRPAQKGQVALDAVRPRYPAAARLWDISVGLTNARWPGATMEHAS
ncbi:hypothetical protein PQQ96_40040 [Paraburkholderia sediminicola]|uniref:hypothetical protein n=1 Tax=Paraburkholderia sediminicola TaxID=458836 RepID=UPI0038B8F492